MEARLWDKKQTSSGLTSRPKRPPTKIVRPPPAPAPAPSIGTSDAAINTDRNFAPKKPEPIRRPSKRSSGAQTDRDHRPAKHRPQTAPGPKPRPNPILGEGGYSGGFGGGGGGGLRPLGRPGSAGIPQYDAKYDKNLIDHYKKKFGQSAGKKLKKKAGLKPFKIRVETGEKKGSGTEARVFLTLFGTKGKSQKKRVFKFCGNSKQDQNLVPFKFSSGSAHTFTIDFKNIGIIEKILVEHDGYEEADSWFLKSIAITPEDSPDTYTFPCDKWLSLYKADCQVARELLPVMGKKPGKTKFEIITITGDRLGAGTDANVFITVFGSRGRTEKLPLHSKSVDAFERGQSDVFVVNTHNVGTMKKIRIEQDGRGRGSDWFLERVVVTDQQRPHEKYYFVCNGWLNDKEGMFRDLVGSTDPNRAGALTDFKITVKTGDFRRAGTDADVYVTIYGDQGDTGQQYLDNKMENNFERGREDVFALKLASVGNISKLRVGHNNQGPSPGWFLDSIIIEAEGRTSEFICQRWLSKNEDDGKIERELLLDGKESIFVHNVAVKTGDERGAGTNAKVWCELFDENQNSTGKIQLRGGSFERGDVDHFPIELTALYAPLSYIYVGHDDGGVGADWFLGEVVIGTPAAGIEQTFDCNQWLKRGKGSSSMVKLTENKTKRRKIASSEGWICQIFTSEIRGAGTNANVSIQVYDVNGQRSLEIPLDNKTDNFEEGATDRFTLNIPQELEQLYKVRIWHDGSRPLAGWHLNKIFITNPVSNERYEFNCDRWLAASEDDGEIIRELPATGESIKTPGVLKPYKVSVKTGNVFGSGTDANVFVNIFGALGDTGARPLQKSTNINKFERNKLDEFLIEAVELGDIDHIQIGHDNWGGNAGWFLDEVTVTDTITNKAVTFPCGRWLDQKEDDGKIVRDLYLDGNEMLHTTRYTVRVKTGDKMGAGTNANVYMQLFGDKGSSSTCQLKQNENEIRNKFERGQVDIFHIETGDVGAIDRIILGHDGSGIKDGWYVESVEIEVPSLGTLYCFGINEWFATSEGDGLIERELTPTKTENRDGTISYQIEVHTGDERFAGTDANVFVQIYGEDGKTEQKILNDRSDNFERGKIDQFKLEDVDVGEVHKIRIGHDDAKLGSGWYLGKVIVSKFQSGTIKKYFFTCNKWLDSKRDDKVIVRELPAIDENGNLISKSMEEITYTVVVVTGDERGSGTDANVFLTITGENGDSGERPLTESDKFNKFEKGSEDMFTLTSMNLGALETVKIRHDNTGLKSGWFLDHIKISAPVLEETIVFPCKKWLAKDEDDGQIQRSLMGIVASQWQNKRRDSIALEQKAAGETYLIKIKTGDVRGAGTDANVYMQLFGDKDDTGIVELKVSQYRNKWERDQTDEFSFDFIGLGDDIKKVRLGHDNKGVKSGWYVASVSIDCPSLGKSWRFPVGQWFAKDEGDQQIERDLYPDVDDTAEYDAAIPYELTIKTSDIRSAGTNASVFVQLFGTDGSQSKNVELEPDRAKRRDRFGRSASDVFVIQAPDLGELEKMRIGHDGSGIGSGWHLDSVTVRTLKNADDPLSGSESVTFPANRWLADDEGDRCTTVDLLPAGAIIQNRTYTVTVITGDKLGAGTDANLFLTMTGENGDSPEIPLKDSETNRNKFERAQTDIFKLVTPDLGRVFKIKLRSDYSGLLNAKWFCQEVKIITDDPVEEPIIFYCERWFSKDGNRGKKAGKLERVFYCQGYDPEKMTAKSTTSSGSGGSWHSRASSVLEGPVTKYEVRIKTGDESGAASSTEPDAYIKFVGKDESTKRINLQLPSNEDRFEKGGINEFTFENMDIDEITAVEIGSRNQEEEWLIDSIDITMPLKGKHLFFKVNNWIGRYKGDGLLNRTLDISDSMSLGSMKAKTSYEVTVMTGNQEGSGLDDGDVYLTLNGDTKTISDMKLNRNESSFGRGGRDVFDLDLENIEPIQALIARVQADSSKSAWLCDRIEVRNTESGAVTIFQGGDWIHGSGSLELSALGDKQTEKVNYKIQVKTSDKFGAGTDANVKVKLTGENGESSEWALDKSETYEDPFEKGNIDEFTFDGKINLGELFMCRVWHDNAGLKSGWHLEYIIVMQGDRHWKFNCNQWLAKTEGDRQIMRELKVDSVQATASSAKTNYRIKISSGDVKHGGTSNDFSVVLYGENGRQVKQRLQNRAGLQQAATTEFQLDDVANVGVIKEVGVALTTNQLQQARSRATSPGDDNRAYITIVEVIGDNNNYKIEFDEWVDTNEMIKPAVIQSGQALQMQRQMLKYNVQVITSDEKGAGTDANVKITMYGSLGDSGQRALEKRWRDLFERGQSDVFELDCIDLGDLERIKLEHDNKLINPDWKPSRVIITTGNNEWLFPCGKWIGKKKGNGLEEQFNVFNNTEQQLPVEQKKKKKGLFGFRS